MNELRNAATELAFLSLRMKKCEVGQHDVYLVTGMDEWNLKAFIEKLKIQNLTILIINICYYTVKQIFYYFDYNTNSVHGTCVSHPQICGEWFVD